MLKILLFLMLAAFLFPVTGYASVNLELDSPSVILVEQSTGRILYSRDERARKYPASLTKMLTALISVEYLDLEQEIIVGQEIRNMPPGFASNIHYEGETINVEMLLRAMLIRSSNETGRVLALNIVRQQEDQRDIQFSQAERIFSNMMNEKARSLGAVGTNFNNPFGSHSENHFTTAYDMAIITKAFMSNPILAEIAGTRTYEGWTNTNQMLPNAPHGHPYIIGAKAGFTTPAGHSFAAAAEFGDVKLISVVMGGTETGRWQDTRRLMDYGFFNFTFHEISQQGQFLETKEVENPRLGESPDIEIISSESHFAFISHAEYATLERTITLDPSFYTETEILDEYGNAETVIKLLAPIEYGAEIGFATYSAGGFVFLQTPVLAGRAVYERNLDSDMDYYFSMFLRIFSRPALPYWFGVFGIAFGFLGIIIAIKTSRKAGRNAGWVYEKHSKNRYSRYR